MIHYKPCEHLIEYWNINEEILLSLISVSIHSSVNHRLEDAFVFNCIDLL